jgi:hypothetical protein
MLKRRGQRFHLAFAGKRGIDAERDFSGFGSLVSQFVIDPVSGKSADREWEGDDETWETVLRAFAIEPWAKSRNDGVALERYLSDLPLLHTWDSGATWNTGGFCRETFEAIHPFVVELSDILETGAGNSTIFFLLHKPRRLVSIAPDAGLFERIHAYCDRNGIDRSCCATYVDCSEWVLPTLARDQQFDFILIDGGHGWPVVFVDFCYATAMLRQGGILAIDDTQLHSIKELGRFLMCQPEFQFVMQNGKTALFRKVTNARSLPDWVGQPYIVSRTDEHQRSHNPNAI